MVTFSFIMFLIFFQDFTWKVKLISEALKHGSWFTNERNLWFRNGSLLHMLMKNVSGYIIAPMPYNVLPKRHICQIIRMTNRFVGIKVLYMILAKVTGIVSWCYNIGFVVLLPLAPLMFFGVHCIDSCKNLSPFSHQPFCLSGPKRRDLAQGAVNNRGRSSVYYSQCAPFLYPN